MNIVIARGLYIIKFYASLYKDSSLILLKVFARNFKRVFIKYLRRPTYILRQRHTHHRILESPRLTIQFHRNMSSLTWPPVFLLFKVPTCH